MLDNLNVDFIYFGHGIDQKNHLLPHSHLFEYLDVDELELNTDLKKVYIRDMTDKHLTVLFKDPTLVRFHVHGQEDWSTKDEVEHMKFKLHKYRTKLINFLLTLSGICLIFGTYLFTQGLPS
tara:strand:+ start:2914 stop:3279 length:366 start_codon:yes stop_codon:yes gene_type:complete